MINFMMFLEFALALAVIILVLSQESKTDALSGLIQGSKTESFYSKNKNKTKKSILENITWVTMSLFMINTLLLNIV